MAELILAQCFAVQTMTPDQVGFAIELAANEGWNPGLHDASCFYNTDPQMYTGDAPAIAINGIYGVTTFELG